MIGYVSGAKIYRNGKPYKRTIFTARTNIGKISVAEINYVLWKIDIVDGKYVANNSCYII